MANACAMPDPSKCGNVYYRSFWDYCTEYKVGDLVKHNGIFYLAERISSGKEPKDNPDYWSPLGFTPPPLPPSGRIIIDGGYAEPSNRREMDGGESDGRVHIPLI